MSKLNKNEIQQILDDEKPISDKMDEFLGEVDKLCWKYGYEILPNDEKTIKVMGRYETVKLLFIDGDGRGK